jgi:hypothetical protein
MRHRIAQPEDSGILGELNHQLIKDEGHRNSMSIPQLVERMCGWLTTDYRASFLKMTQASWPMPFTGKVKTISTCDNSSCNAISAVSALVANA